MCSNSTSSRSGGCRCPSRSGALVVFGDVGVTDQHCTKVSPIESTVQYRFATPKPLKARPWPKGCVTAPLCKPRPRILNPGFPRTRGDMPCCSVQLRYTSTGRSKIICGGWRVPSFYTAGSWFTEPWISQPCFAEHTIPLLTARRGFGKAWRRVPSATARIAAAARSSLASALRFLRPLRVRRRVRYHSRLTHNRP